jgi:hypothetical protein
LSGQEITSKANASGVRRQIEIGYSSDQVFQFASGVVQDGFELPVMGSAQARPGGAIIPVAGSILFRPSLISTHFISTQLYFYGLRNHTVK